MPTKTRQQAANKAHRARVGQLVAHALRQTVDGALTAYVAQFGLQDLPGPAFDAALKGDPGHVAARREFNKALKRLFALMPDATARKRLLTLEEAATALSVSSATVGWRLGLAARGSVNFDSGVAALGGRISSSTVKGSARRDRG